MFRSFALGTTLLRAFSVPSALSSAQAPSVSVCPYRPFGIFASMAKRTSPVPPQAPNDFVYTPDDINRIVDTAIARSRKLEDEIAALKPQECTFDSVVRRLALDEGLFDTETDPATFMQSVSTQKAVRDAANDATQRISDFAIESSMRADIYQRLLDAQQNTAANSLDAESSRLLEKMLLDKKRAGLGLPEDKQADFKKLKMEMEKLKIEFRKNCDEESGFILFTKEELDGIPASVISGYPTQEDAATGKHKVTHKVKRYSNCAVA